MRGLAGGRFLLGLAGGLLIGVAGADFVAGAMIGTDVAAPLRQGFTAVAPALQRIDRDLGASTPLFALVMLFYVRQMLRLRALLDASDTAVEGVVRHEQLLDLCASLFFGIGVIWTAIGMRDALLFALGDPGQAAAQGAAAVLERLVEGGILLSLSTTIVGGIGGYLMRAGKSVFLGRRLAACYLESADAPARENLRVLERIEAQLARGKPREEPREEPRKEPREEPRPLRS